MALMYGLKPALFKLKLVLLKLTQYGQLFQLDTGARWR
jgi:hypothetical protein